MDKLLDILKSADFPYAYDHFAEGEAPDPPFVCYLLPGRSATNVVFSVVSAVVSVLF